MNLFESNLIDECQWLRVGDSYEITTKPRGFDLSLSAFKTVPLVPMEAIPRGGAFSPDYVFKSPTAITSSTYFEQGDILVAKITPSFENGKQALTFDLPMKFGFATTEVIPLRPRDVKHDRRLLFFYLLHPAIRRYIAARMEGSTGRQRVPKNVLLDLPFPVFCAKDQRTIANSLELIQRAKAAESEAEQATKALKCAAMRSLFTRGLRGEAQKETGIGPVPESWEPKTIRELCEIWSGGTPRKSIADYWNGNIPWASGKDLKSPILDDTIDHVTSEAIEAGSRLAPTGSLLLLVRGMGLAKDLPVGVINRPIAFNQDIKALVSRGNYSGKFLRSVVYAGKERLLRQIVTSAHGTMTLNLSDVENFKVPCPSDPTEADEIVAILDAIDRKIDLHRRKRTVLEELFKALLHKLMTGEIRVGDLEFDESVDPITAVPTKL